MFRPAFSQVKGTKTSSVFHGCHDLSPSFLVYIWMELMSHGMVFSIGPDFHPNKNGCPKGLVHVLASCTLTSFLHPIFYPKNWLLAAYIYRIYVDIYIYTLQKSNIDTKNCHFEGNLFQGPSFWGSETAVMFQGCNHFSYLSTVGSPTMFGSNTW